MFGLVVYTITGTYSSRFLFRHIPGDDHHSDSVDSLVWVLTVVLCWMIVIEIGDLGSVSLTRLEVLGK